MRPTSSFTPGALRERVTIQVRSTAQDSQGEQVHTWTTFAERRAELIASTGSETWASQQRTATVPTTFRLRYLAGVLPEMRLLHGDRVYEIRSAFDPTARKEELHLICEELVGEAP